MGDALAYDREALERARLSRDSRFDGRFFIAITSTRIYCRPICPSPESKPANVRYYSSAAAAAEAGFRPCLRCRPEAAPGTPAWLGTSAVVRRGLRLIQDGFLDEASVDDLAGHLGIGPRHLHRLFVQHVGASPVTVAQTRRLQFAKTLLDETDLTITQIAMASGFGSLRRFNDAFRATYARAPREMRRQRRNGNAGNAGRAVALRLSYRPPYAWREILGFLAARAIPDVERLDADGYARTLLLPEGPAVVRVGRLEHEHTLELRVEGAAPPSLFQVSATARRCFDLASDPARIAHGLEGDPLLGALVRRTPGLRIPGVWDPFECAVRAVLGQQVSVAGSRTLAARLVARAGGVVPAGPPGLTRLFPTPAAVAAADLSGLGLTTARAQALRTLAAAVASGRLDLSGPSEDVTAALAALPGIGSWTAQYIALRGLGEPDAFPAEDLVVRRLAGADGKPLATRALLAQAEAWRPWRGYAVLHLWYAAAARAARPGSRRPAEPRLIGPIRDPQPRRHPGTSPRRSASTPRPGAAPPRRGAPASSRD